MDFPYFKNEEGQIKYINKNPISIFNCWNFVIVFNTSFLKIRQLKFKNVSLVNKQSLKKNYYIIIDKNEN